MEQEFDLEYVVVEVIIGKSLAVIPKNWLPENYASFPPYTNARKVKSAAISREIPTKNCKIFQVNEWFRSGM